MEKDFRTLAEQKIADDPINRFWENPLLSANEQPFRMPLVDTKLEKQLKHICELTEMDYGETLDHYMRVVNAEQTGQRNASMAELAEEYPGLMSAVSVLMVPVDLVGAAYGAANLMAGRQIDVNSPAYMGTNSRMATREQVKRNIETNHGAGAGAGYEIAMSFFDALYGATVVGGGKTADGIEAASSAVNTYISLIDNGVSPEAAGVQAGLQAALDVVDLSGIGDEVLGEVARLTYQERNVIMEKNRRRTWRESEKVAELLFPDYQTQASFWNRKPADYALKGSVRPDLVGGTHSIEVKNYKLSKSTNTNRLIHVIGKQYDQRTVHLPEGMQQHVLIDVLGQDISNEKCLEIIDRIHKRTDDTVLVWIVSN